jgi:hypothetical protein
MTLFVQPPGRQPLLLTSADVRACVRVWNSPLVQHTAAAGSVRARDTLGSEPLLCAHVHVIAAGSTRLFDTCTYCYVCGFLRRCGCPQAGIRAG